MQAIRRDIELEVEDDRLILRTERFRETGRGRDGVPQVGAAQGGPQQGGEGEVGPLKIGSIELGTAEVGSL